MPNIRCAALLIALATALGAGAAAAQSSTAPEAAQTTQPNWAGLPFQSVASYEQLIPIGMTRAELVRILGDPAAIMPGRDADQVYHYEYRTADDTELRAVIVLRDDAVLIRRLYTSSVVGASRLN